MSYFFIIRGPAGVGKTTVAKNLAKLLHAYHISFDDVLVNHNLDQIAYDLSIPCIPEHNMLAANKIVINIAREKLSAKQIVIFDGNFYHKSQIEDLVGQLNFPYIAHTLKASLKECIARNRQRAHPLDNQAIRVVFELVSKFDYGNVVDTNGQTIDTTVRKIMDNREAKMVSHKK